MEALDFINKEIEATKRSHKAFELDYELFHRESDNRDAEELKKKLIQLQQIKVELEAWEEIKKYLVLNEGCIYEDSYYEYLTLQNDCIDETESEEQGVSLEIIKKALEVEE